MHMLFIVFTAAIASTGLGVLPASNGMLALPLVVLAGAIQVRHSLAAASGKRPRFWPWTLLLFVVLAYAPAPIFTVRWGTMKWLVIASAAMLLPTRLAIAAIGATVSSWAGWNVTFGPPGMGIARVVWSFAYPATVLLMGGASLYGAARLVQFAGELREARAELAELAVGRERLRISRNLHDLLGQTLSAVSLKGDLALRFLEGGDASHATAETESLTTARACR